MSQFSRYIFIAAFSLLAFSCQRSKSIVFSDLYRTATKKGLVLCLETSRDTTDIGYFGERVDARFKKHFVAGKSVMLDEGITDEPMFFISELTFDSDSVAKAYSKCLRRDVFVIYNFWEEHGEDMMREVNMLHNACARIYRKNKSVYFLNSCWDIRLRDHFNAVSQQIDSLKWDEVIVDFSE